MKRRDRGRRRQLRRRAPGRASRRVVRLPPAREPRAGRRARLVHADPSTRQIELMEPDAWTRRLGPGDVVVVNDAATLSASYWLRNARGVKFELRLAAYEPDSGRFLALVLGDGDHTLPTEERGAPPELGVGERIGTEGLELSVTAMYGQRVVGLEVKHPSDEAAVWQKLTTLGTPIQYCHLTQPLEAWDVQTPFAGRPWAFEMPSAGRFLSLSLLGALRRRRVEVVGLTHAAGLSSTGDETLDASLPWPERYDLPASTVRTIDAARALGGRVVAVGTSVARALESAAIAGSLGAGPGVARLRLNAGHPLRVVDGLLTGLHDSDTSHHALLGAFGEPSFFENVLSVAQAEGLVGHEFGDGLLVLSRRRDAA